MKEIEMGRGFLYNAFNLPGIWVSWVVGIVLFVLIIALLESDRK
jgi:quinol-cytochrome oxidoreductase complex cytochrome b subunit